MSKIFLALALSIIIGGCSSINKSKVVSTKPVVAMTENNSTAQVTNIKATGEANNYTFAVTVKSPDTGCDRKRLLNKIDGLATHIAVKITSHTLRLLLRYQFGIDVLTFQSSLIY